ncbi:SDR family NAD(P)-dependent oxidoreductase [Tsukamurella soli]|uniref:SDR family NAD(P)-dependent oxidoreductase n=1 Tax=Tsukamurella soli TaxID=644556 RepID=UPI00361BC2CD
MLGSTNGLSGRTAIVTGAAGGIGSAIARALAREGVTVVGLDAAHAVTEVLAKMGVSDSAVTSPTPR